ncbi:MAG: vitamin K epoxide reductase family protein [Muribaculum sp.]|nr:vitamin K epoxide reductase family protein [Muribaculaceae bacterium]MCM1081012.1 vitamin K epoxide reductase family protein [Muribaculum sp.]
MAKYTLFTRYLDLLGIPFTFRYSNMRFRAYPSKIAIIATDDLMTEYGAKMTMTHPSDKAELTNLNLPAMVQLESSDSLIVTSINNGNVVTINANGEQTITPLEKFVESWNGKSVSVININNCCETNYSKHHFQQTSAIVERWVLALCSLFLLFYFAITNGLFKSWPALALLALYSIGILICRLLILKQSNSESHAADRVCKVIQQNGCSTVLHHDGASLFGLFPWCEIGMTYFSVSFLALLLWPECLPWLAAASACCLPYTIWSVSYQKFKIHAWCTLCLCVQSLFWIIFIVCLTGKCFYGVFPLRFQLVVLLVCYLTTLLLIHKLLPKLFHYDIANGETGQ